MKFKKVKYLSRWSLSCGSTAQLTRSYRKPPLQLIESGVGAHHSGEVKCETTVGYQVQGTIVIVQGCAAPQHPGTGSLFETMLCLSASVLMALSNLLHDLVNLWSGR